MVNYGTIIDNVTAGGNITIGDPSEVYFLRDQLRAKDRQIRALLSIIKDMRNQ